MNSSNRYPLSSREQVLDQVRNVFADGIDALARRGEQRLFEVSGADMVLKGDRLARIP